MERMMTRTVRENGVDRTFRIAVKDYARIGAPAETITWDDQRAPRPSPSTREILGTILLMLLGCLGCEAELQVKSGPTSAPALATAAADTAWIDLIETREDIIYRLFSMPDGALVWLANDETRQGVREAIDHVLERDFATWPKAMVRPGNQAGGHRDSGGPSDSTGGHP